MSAFLLPTDHTIIVSFFARAIRIRLPVFRRNLAPRRLLVALRGVSGVSFRWGPCAQQTSRTIRSRAFHQAAVAFGQAPASAFKTHFIHGPDVFSAH